MQLKFKKIFLLSTVIIYCASFLIQSNFSFFQARAKEKNIPRVNIVTILVDNDIYDKISGPLQGYAEYIGKHVADAKPLIIPLDLENIHAYDIHRMLENIYFDGLTGVNSSFVGLVMFGDIPLPVVNQHGFIFPTVYPYVDFEHQKYVWDPKSEYFVLNNNPNGQAEVWHGLINYGKEDIKSYLDFFEKVQSYDGDPEGFIGKSIWFDDFISQKKGFLSENFSYYRNRIMFAEDLGYQRHSPLMRKMFRKEKKDSAFGIMGGLEQALGEFDGRDLAEEIANQGVDGMHSTKMIQQELGTSFTLDYADLFSSQSSSTMRENILAGGRWIQDFVNASGEKLSMVNADSSISKMRIKDEVLLGSNDMQGLIENLNELMERAIDKKIKDKNLSMDIVVPVSYEEVTKKWVDTKCYSFVDHYENYYFGLDARIIDKAEDLSIYRGTYRNLTGLEGVTYESLLEGKNPIKTEYEKTDLRLKSIGGSYDIFSSQAEGNRGYNMLGVDRDLNIYDEEKTRAKAVTHRSITRRVKVRSWPKDCDDQSDDEDEVCETLNDFAKRWWGGASPINLIPESVQAGKYQLKDYLATDSWRWIFGMEGFQSLVLGEDEGPNGTGWYHGTGVGPQWDANSFKAYIKYSSPTQTQGRRPVSWALIGWGYEVYDNHTPDVHIPFSSINYWQLPRSVISSWDFKKDRTSDKVFHVEKKSADILGCIGSDEEYTYKVINSIVKHDSTTEDQINGIDRDRYGEDGILNKYYQDIKSSYEKVLDDVGVILKGLSELISDIKDLNEYIKSKMNDLNSVVGDLSQKNQEIANLETQLASLQAQLQSAEEGEEEGILQQINSVQKKIQTLKSDKTTIEGNAESILNEVSQRVKQENAKLLNIFKLVMSLYVGNIQNVLEFVIYLEGGDPNDYEGGNAKNLVKVGFPSSRISDINGVESEILGSSDKVVEYYDQAYSLIQKQQEDWAILAEKLKEESEGIDDKIDKVTGEMNEVLTLSYNVTVNTDSDNETETYTETVTLTGGTASSAMGELNSDLKNVDETFSKFVEEDKVGPAIVEAAKSDIDFLKWMRENSINYGEFSDDDRINQYAQWTKGPGYDSKGAIKNHDLLLGVSEHMSGMNILTADRPIDSPRYVVMQSVAGNEMKFIYPDLFKVEVYQLSGQDLSGNDIHILLTGGQIKKNLIKYLSGKVKEYNDIVGYECNNAAEMNSYYSKLSDLGYELATPDKGLHSCGEPFTYDELIEALGGIKMLDVISETLYYQSLTNKKKSSSKEIAKDIELIKKSFGVNDKRVQIMEDYLVKGKEEIKDALFEIPTYQISGYEVAYINSDGRDYLFPEHTEDEEFEQTVLQQVSDDFDIEITQPTSQEIEIADECNIPADGKLSILTPWINGFKCWLKKTLEQPIKLKLTFDNSLGQTIYSASIGDDIRKSDSTTSFNDWGELRNRYADKWDFLVDSGTGYDADFVITQLQVNSEKHNQEVIGGDDPFSNLLFNISRNVKISNTDALLSDSNPSSELRIESSVDVGKVTVEFIGTGDGCLKIDSDDLCGGKVLRKTFNPKTDPFVGKVSSSDNVAGKNGLIIRIGVESSYIENVIKYTVSPGLLERFDIIVGDTKTVAGMITPIEVVGFDKYGNRVDWGLEKYYFTVTTGRFLINGLYETGFSTNDFRDLRFNYQAPLDAPDKSEALIQIKSSLLNGKVLETHTQTIIQADPVIKINGNVVLSGRDLEVNIPYDLNSSYDIYDGGKLNISKLQVMEIDMKDPKGNNVDLDSQILVTSQNRLMIMGLVNKKEDGTDVFFETSKSYMSGGHVTLYFYPSMTAGNDIVNIDIPGLPTRVINYGVSAGSTMNVQLDMKGEYVRLYDSVDFEIYTSDPWGNATSANVILETDPRYVEFPELPVVFRDETSVRYMATTINGYLKTPIYGTGAGLASVSAGGASITFKVDRSILPQSGLNIMYLNFFGNDWGNQWGYFSENDNYVEHLMTGSKRIITTTTQLVSEKKIKKLMWKIEPGFKITNLENVDTSMTMEDGRIDMLIGGLSKMRDTSPKKFIWKDGATFNSIYTLLDNPKTENQNYIFFMPSDPKYSMKDGKLYSSGEYLGDFFNGEITIQLGYESLDNGDNIWKVIDRGVEYGSLIFHYPSFMPSVGRFVCYGDRYLVSPVFAKGSTDNLSSVGVFDGISELELETNYKSIQNSDEMDEKVGFLGKFKNITLFAEGEIVGEATRKYGSELLINLGDPVLTRMDANKLVYGTQFDGGIGEEFFNDPEKDIVGVRQIDFNGDGGNDWLYVYYDGSLKLAKNYGNKTELRNMQELMRVAVHIQDAFVGDADGNGYEDIFVLTDNNQIRVYMNSGGVFDSDGSLACLNQNVFGGQVSTNPSSLEGVVQFFVDDMDSDGKADIIVYDEKGYIKTFFGGSTKDGPNYLSKNKYYCDTGWYDRELPNTTVVTALGIQISSADVYDNSMMTWEGIYKPVIEEITEDQLPYYGVKFDPETLQDKVKPRDRNEDGSIKDITEEIMDKDKFDVTIMSSRYKGNEAKRLEETLYDTTLLGSKSKNYLFAPSHFIDPDPMNCEDLCKTYKNFYVKDGGSILMDRDIVTVRVTVYASKCGCRGAFGDVIQGPRNVYYDENDVIMGDEGKVGVRPLENWRNSVVKRKDGNFSFFVDNIVLGPFEEMKFEYDLEYHHIPVKKMTITRNTFYGEGPDIKLQSVDGCEKDFDVYHGGRTFTYEHIPLQEMIDKAYYTGDLLTEDLAEDVISYGSDVNQLQGIVGDTINRAKIIGALKPNNTPKGEKEYKSELNSRIKGGLLSLSTNLDVNLDLFEGVTDEIENVVDDIIKGMCNGFNFGSSNCEGLPVPFNQAFLAPGGYHIFGCRKLMVGPLMFGVPMFNFPGTMYAAGVPVPIPWGLKGPSDLFLWPGYGPYDSYIRIYAAPTLTAQLGIAVCMGNYAVGYALQSPWADLGGNCVVFTVKPQCKNGKEHNEIKEDRNNPNAVYANFVDEVMKSGICLQSTKGPNAPNTPFVLSHYSSVYHGEPYYKEPVISLRNQFEENVKQNGVNQYNVSYSASPVGLINLERAAYIGQDDYASDRTSFMIGDVDILGGKYNVNRIRGGVMQGIRAFLIDKWLDPQIRYIVNHLTKMHININLPDLSNLIGNEVQTIKNASQNIGNIWKNDDESQRLAPLTSWSDVSYDNMRKLNKSISNPFDALASLMNESNIINISVEPITVKVPMIFAEDITTYEIYLQQWLEVNSGVVSRWKGVLSGETFDLSIGGDWAKLQGQIYANLMTLQKYRNFPYEIYEWIHAIDRYLAEIAALINDTIGYLSYWTSTNSHRFVGYVDAIVLMINIIRTYQVIIDFSLNWGQNCGNCTRDTYDQYTCILSILCLFSLPIIQIPNFKIPNITLDLTDIDLGLDIVLPDFNFQPIRINLPDLPNLPEPPAFGVDINISLPDIPVLPEPPSLPELPSFIPNVDLELPILPPAPTIPSIPSSIEGFLDIAELIGKILCIIKLKFGLVGERSVKAKIEQLTQRTYEVKWIDALLDFTNLTIGGVHNYGLDYEVSSHVDFQFDFRDFYNYLDSLTTSINNLSTSSVNWLNNQVDSAITENPLTKVRNSIDGLDFQIEGDVDVGADGIDGDFGSISILDEESITPNLEGLTSDEIEYVPYSDAKLRLEQVLAYVRKKTIDTSFGEDVDSSVGKIENQINKVSDVKSNSEGIKKLGDEVFDYLGNAKSGYDSLERMINEDYDGFLAMIDAQYNNSKTKSSLDAGKVLAFNVNLFNVDPSTRDTINTLTKTNPYEEILDNKKSIVDGFWNAINTNTADELGLTKMQYLALRNEIGSMKKQVTTLYSVVRPESTTELVAKGSNVTTNKSLLAFEPNEEGARLGSNMKVADVIDPSVLSIGIYEPIGFGSDEGKMVKVVYADSFASAIKDQYLRYTREGDILLWDEDATYLKCQGGECGHGGGGYRVAHSKVLKEIPFKETWLKFNDGSELKIADSDHEVLNWNVIGQTYDGLYLSWDLEEVDAYLIKLVERIDHSYEKADYNGGVPVHYVLALPDSVASLGQLIDNKTKLEILNKVDLIKNLYGNELVEVVYYDSHKAKATIAFTNVERKWYYARIATLDFVDNTYNINSPWSNQVVASKQMVGDDAAPEGVAVLYRPSVQEIVATGDNLDAYVGTKYELRVNWDDNMALFYVRLLDPKGNIVDEKWTSEPWTLKTDIPIHTKKEEEIYTSIGIDQFGNQTEKTIKISYDIPEIAITDISENLSGETTITAELSHDIDKGTVTFQKRRGNVWKTIVRNGSPADYELAPRIDRIEDAPYTAGNEMAAYDKNGDIIALINPETAEIEIMTGYKDSFEIKAVVQDSLVLQLYNKKEDVSVFSISVPSEKCVKLEADNYNVVDLSPNGKMGLFNGGKAIHKDGTNLLFTSPRCQMYSEIGLEGDYEFDQERQAVLITLYPELGLSKGNPIKVWFKARPFVYG